MKPPLLEAPASAFLISLTQVILMLCLFFSLVYGAAELTFFSLFMLAVGLGTFIWSRVSPRSVSFTLKANRKRLFPGDRLKIRTQIANDKFLPILLTVDLFIPQGVSNAKSGQWISDESALFWYQQAGFAHNFFPNRRGVFDLGPPRIRSGDLFGFYPRFRAVTDRFEVIVYPRIVAIHPLDVPRREFFGTPGARSPVVDPVFIFGTRDYQAGSPARYIHWKASARHDRLQEKLCEPAAQEKALLLLDVDGFQAAENFDRFEGTLEVLASLVLQLTRRGIAVGFATNGSVSGKKPRILPISSDSNQVSAILETLARVTAAVPGTAMGDLLSRGYNTPAGVSCIYFARRPTKSTRDARAFMKHRMLPFRTVLAEKPDDVQKGKVRTGDILYVEDIRV